MEDENRPNVAALQDCIRDLSPALRNFEQIVDELSSSLADCHVFADCARADSSTVIGLLSELRTSFSQLDPLYESIDRLEHMVSLANAQADMLEHDVVAVEREWYIKGTTGMRPSSSTFASSTTSSQQQQQQQGARGASSFLKKLFKGPTAGSSAAQRAASPTAPPPTYSAPPLVFRTSDFFPPSTAATIDQTGGEAALPPAEATSVEA